MNKFKEWVLGWILGTINGFDNNVLESVNILSKDILSGEKYEFAKAVAEITIPVALTIAGIMFFAELFKITIQFESIRTENIIKAIVKLIIAKVAMESSFNLLGAIYMTSAEWIVEIGDLNSTLGAATGSAIEVLMEDLWSFQVLGIVSTMSIVFIAIAVIGITIKVIAYARCFELLLYIAVSPIACAFIPSENSRIAKKFFLNFSAVCLQGVFMVISIKLYQTICMEELIPAIQGSGEMNEMAYNMLLGALVLIVAITKSSSWAKSLLDAQ